MFYFPPLDYYMLAAPSHSYAAKLAERSQNFSAESKLCLPSLHAHRHVPHPDRSDWYRWNCGVWLGVMNGKITQETENKCNSTKTWFCFKIRFNNNNNDNVSLPMQLETCRCTEHLPDADNLELLCPIVAYLWDRTNLAIGVGYVSF